jgi:dienelactone hydrolase
VILSDWLRASIRVEIEKAMSRNLSPNAYYNAISARHVPEYRFAGKTRQDWARWQRALLPRAIASLGKMPPAVPLNPELQAQWEEDGLIKQRIIFDVCEHLSAVAYLFRPTGVKGPLPGILACHGHGPFGKDSVMGNRGVAERAANIAQHNYDYGLQMAKAGYAVIAIDWRGFGERDDKRKPNWHNTFADYTQCSAAYIRATTLGMTALGLNVHDGRRALDLLCSQEFVDPGRIGVMGLSFGGTMTVWMALADERIKAADVICYSDRFADFHMRDNNSCGSQVTPGLYDLCDLCDLQGLIAPRPLLVEIGSYDDCFMVDSAMACFGEVEKIYSAAGQRDKLVLDLFEGGHQWSGRKSLEFFGKALR